MQPDDRGEERQALVRPRREQLDVADVGDIAEARKRNCGSGHRHVLRSDYEVRPDIGDEIVDRERSRQQALRISHGDSHLEIPSVRLQPKRR